MDLYREHILDHYQSPRNQGPLPDATVSHTEPNPVCGDEVTLHLKVADGRIAAIRFEGRGCAISQAGASLLTEELAGKPVSSAAGFRDQEMLDLLAIPLSPSRTKCGLLAVSCLRRTLA